MGFSDGNPGAKSGSDSASKRVPELFSELRSSFFGMELEKVAKKFIEREEEMNEQLIELEHNVEQLLKDKHLLFLENKELKDDLKKKQKKIDALNAANLAYKNEVNILGCDKMRVLENEKKSVSICSENTQRKACADTAIPAHESCRRPLSSEKGDFREKTEPGCQDIIKVDDEKDEDDDDDDDNQYISILKRKWLPSDIKKDHNSDDIDLDGMSASKAKRASKEIKRDCNSDYVDDNLAATQIGKDPEDLHKQPITSHPLPTPYRAEVKPKHLTSSFNTCNSGPGQNVGKVDEALKSVIAKLRKPKERWESEAAMLEEFDKDDELCLNAVCALHRQKVRLQVYDILRITYLATMLINGDPQQKLRKRASELHQFDLDHCRMFPKQYSSHLFDIYQKKVDPFFPSSEQ